MPAAAQVQADLALGAEVVILTPHAQGQDQGLAPTLPDPAHLLAHQLAVQIRSICIVIWEVRLRHPEASPLFIESVVSAIVA